MSPAGKAVDRLAFRRRPPVAGEVAGDRASEYAGFDSVGQARMNAIPADDEGWIAPGLWAGIRAVRGGAIVSVVTRGDGVGRAA